MSKLRTANLLGALAGAISDRLARHARSHPNETDSAAAALNVIGFYDGCSNGALAAALGLSHTATVRLVDKLEAGGFVESRSASDRRAVALSLTDTGRTRAETLIRDRCVQLGDLITVLTSEQRAALDDIAETLLRAMVTAAGEAEHICRLCDGAMCPEDRCPVHLKALALEAA